MRIIWYRYNNIYIDHGLFFVFIPYQSYYHNIVLTCAHIYSCPAAHENAVRRNAAAAAAAHNARAADVINIWPSYNNNVLIPWWDLTREKWCAKLSPYTHTALRGRSHSGRVQHCEEVYIYTRYVCVCVCIGM